MEIEYIGSSVDKLIEINELVESAKIMEVESEVINRNYRSRKEVIDMDYQTEMNEMEKMKLIANRNIMKVKYSCQG